MLKETGLLGKILREILKRKSDDYFEILLEKFSNKLLNKSKDEIFHRIPVEEPLEEYPMNFWTILSKVTSGKSHRKISSRNLRRRNLKVGTSGKITI